jgi:CheY-like chemotaxis protein
MMPDEPGWDFVERLLKHPALYDIPVALMSTSLTAMQADRRVREDRASLLSKPIDVKKVVTLAASHCRCRLSAAKFE